MGTKNSKRFSFLKSLSGYFKLFLNFLLRGPHKSTLLDFWNFEFLIFHILYFVFVNMRPYGRQTSHYSSLKSLWNYFKLFLHFLLSARHKSTVLDFWKFEFFIFHIFCSAWLCQQSSWNRNLSVLVRRPSVVRPSLNLMHYFQILVAATPKPYARTFFEFLKKKYFFIFFLRIFLVCVSMGPYGSQNVKTLLLLQIATESFPEFSS